jgi:hypothetical protein
VALSGPEYIEVWDYENGTMERVPLHVTRVDIAFPALPAHEYCTPITRNLFLGDDPHDLPFIPFADDPTFDLARYLEEYKTFSWRESAVDPDCEFHPPGQDVSFSPGVEVEVVVVETARRLHTEHQMPYRHIDETGVLPLELLDRGATRGMVYRSRRR